MLDIISQMTGKAAKPVKNWWLLLIAGLLGIAAGVAVFCFPADSCYVFSIMFGVIMLVTGVTELAVAVSSRNWFMMRGYNIEGGILTSSSASCSAHGLRLRWQRFRFSSAFGSSTTVL